MSAKSSRPAKPKSATPRQLIDIQKDYQEKAFNAGQVQYQIYVLTKDLETLNELLEDVNKEAAARNQLDKETPKQEEQAAPSV